MTESPKYDVPAAPFKRVLVHFESEEDLRAFAAAAGLNPEALLKTRSSWWPPPKLVKP